VTLLLPAKNKFDPSLPIADAMASICRPNQNFRDYLSKLDALVAAIVAAMVAGQLPLPAFQNAANDAAAAAAGVQVGQMYRNGSVLMVRVT
jgi:hypothetical protein